MKTVVIGINNKGVDNIHYLPPSFYHGKTRYVIHQNPVIEQDGDVVEANCDWYFDFSSKVNKRAQLLMGEYYIPFTREAKSLQMTRLLMADQQIMETPTLYHTEGRGHFAMGVSEFGHPLKGKVVVKRENGARGCDQAVVPTHQLDNFLRVCCDESMDSLKERFPDVVFTDRYPDSASGPFTHDKILITEYVEGITAEYRLLVGGHQRLALERGIQEKEYRQANLDLNTPLSGAPAELLDYKDLFTTTEVEQIEALIELFDIRLGSVDLYRTKTGDLGFFEWSPQFGTRGYCHEQMRNFHMNFVIDTLK